MQITVPISLVLEVSDEEVKKYYLNEDGTPALSFTADFFDLMLESASDTVITINGLTYAALREKLTVEAALS